MQYTSYVMLPTTIVASIKLHAVELNRFFSISKVTLFDKVDMFATLRQGLDSI